MRASSGPPAGHHAPSYKPKSWTCHKSCCQWWSWNHENWAQISSTSHSCWWVSASTNFATLLEIIKFRTMANSCLTINPCNSELSPLGFRKPSPHLCPLSWAERACIIPSCYMGDWWNFLVHDLVHEKNGHHDDCQHVPFCLSFCSCLAGCLVHCDLVHCDHYY